MRKTIVMCGLFVAGVGFVGSAIGQVGAPPGGGGFDRGAGRQDPLQLLNNPSVRKELELSDDQAKAVPEAVMKALGGVLSDKQLKRFKQIELQQRGLSAFADPAVQDKLNLSGSQKDTVKTILEDAAKEMRDLRGGGFDRTAFEKIAGIRKETLEKVTGVLSAEQKSTWREMTGDAFKMERPAFNFGGTDGKKRFEFKKKSTNE